ncbi:unnamed protein product [Amoebophrya sp. A25]|nr:unnamed protein product [Amoebophrya sp. A25]|eukprot:GSA25T00009722001.1
MSCSNDETTFVTVPMATTGLAAWPSLVPESEEQPPRRQERHITAKVGRDEQSLNFSSDIAQQRDSGGSVDDAMMEQQRQERLAAFPPSGSTEFDFPSSLVVPADSSDNRNPKILVANGQPKPANEVATLDCSTGAASGALGTSDIVASPGGVDFFFEEGKKASKPLFSDEEDGSPSKNGFGEEAIVGGADPFSALLDQIDQTDLNSPLALGVTAASTSSTDQNNEAKDNMPQDSQLPLKVEASSPTISADGGADTPSAKESGSDERRSHGTAESHGTSEDFVKVEKGDAPALVSSDPTALDVVAQQPSTPEYGTSSPSMTTTNLHSSATVVDVLVAESSASTFSGGEFQKPAEDVASDVGVPSDDDFAKVDADDGGFGSFGSFAAPTSDFAFGDFAGEDANKSPEKNQSSLSPENENLHGDFQSKSCVRAAAISPNEPAFSKSDDATGTSRPSTPSLKRREDPFASVDDTPNPIEEQAENLQNPSEDGFDKSAAGFTAIGGDDDGFTGFVAQKQNGDDDGFGSFQQETAEDFAVDDFAVVEKSVVMGTSSPSSQQTRQKVDEDSNKQTEVGLAPPAQDGVMEDTSGFGSFQQKSVSDDDGGFGSFVQDSGDANSFGGFSTGADGFGDFATGGDGDDGFGNFEQGDGDGFGDFAGGDEEKVSDGGFGGFAAASQPTQESSENASTASGKNFSAASSTIPEGAALDKSTVVGGVASGSTTTRSFGGEQSAGQVDAASMSAGAVAEAKSQCLEKIMAHLHDDPLWKAVAAIGAPPPPTTTIQYETPIQLMRQAQEENPLPAIPEEQLTDTIVQALQRCGVPDAEQKVRARQSSSTLNLSESANKGFMPPSSTSSSRPRVAGVPDSRVILMSELRPENDPLCQGKVPFFERQLASGGAGKRPKPGVPNPLAMFDQTPALAIFDQSAASSVTQAFGPSGDAFDRTASGGAMDLDMLAPGVQKNKMNAAALGEDKRNAGGAASSSSAASSGDDTEKTGEQDGATTQSTFGNFFGGFFSSSTAAAASSSETNDKAAESKGPSPASSPAGANKRVEATASLKPVATDLLGDLFGTTTSSTTSISNSEGGLHSSGGTSGMMNGDAGLQAPLGSGASSCSASTNMNAKFEAPAKDAMDAFFDSAGFESSAPTSAVRFADSFQPDSFQTGFTGEQNDADDDFGDFGDFVQEANADFSDTTPMAGGESILGDFASAQNLFNKPQPSWSPGGEGGRGKKLTEAEIQAFIDSLPDLSWITSTSLQM